MQPVAVFVLQHVAREREADADVKLVGVYATRQEAQNAIRRLRMAPGFRENPDGFYVDEYLLDQDHWTEGFGEASAQTNASTARSA